MSANKQVTVDHVISQHAEEAAFLWLQREDAISAPHYSLKDLAELDDRVEAHLDGLRVAGDEGWEICCEELQWEEPGEAFAAAVLAYGSGNESRIETIIENVLTSVVLSRGVISALGWLPWKTVAPQARRMVLSSDLRLRRIGLAAYAVHRQDPGQPLIDALKSDNLQLQARGLRAVGQLGLTGYARGLRGSVRVNDLECRFSEAWTLALLGDDDAIGYLVNLADADFRYRQASMEMALRRMQIAKAKAWRHDLVIEKRSHEAIFATGVIGDPDAVPWLIGQMSVPEFARCAGEAFTLITGVDIAYDDLEGDEPEGFEAGPTEEPQDEDVDTDPDEDLPWPNPELIAHWWASHDREFKQGTRYLLGKPINSAWMKEVLKTGQQRQRAAAALELALLERGKPLFEVRAPGYWQQKSLGVA